MARLLEAGLTVLKPWGDNARYDLVVDLGGRFLRIQCKTGGIANGCVTFRTYMIGRDRSKVSFYSPREIDYFGVWCPASRDVFFVPIQDIGTGTRPHLRVDLPRPNSVGARQTANVRWGAKYAAEAVIEGWLRTGGEFDPRWEPPVVEATRKWHASRVAGRRVRLRHTATRVLTSAAALPSP